MHYVVYNELERRMLCDQIDTNRGIGLLEIDTVKVDIMVIPRCIKIKQSFLDDEYTALDYVKELIRQDAIVFYFGRHFIQYTPCDLLKVLEKFDDCDWFTNEVDRQELIRYLKFEILNQQLL